jgi:16S rRNA processing protein RimM
VRGDVRVTSFTADPGNAFAYGPLLGADGAALVTAVSVRAASTHFIVTPKEKRQKEAWDALKGTPLFVPRKALPEPDDAEEFYHEDLIGLSAYRDGVVVARVRAVQNFGGGDLLELTPISGGESWLIPFTREAVPTVDLRAGRIELGDIDPWLAEPDADTPRTDSPED